MRCFNLCGSSRGARHQSDHGGLPRRPSQLAESRPRVRGQFVRVQRGGAVDGTVAAAAAAPATADEAQQAPGGEEVPEEEEEDSPEEEEGNGDEDAQQAGAVETH